MFCDVFLCGSKSESDNFAPERHSKDCDFFYFKHFININLSINLCFRGHICVVDTSLDVVRRWFDKKLTSCTLLKYLPIFMAPKELVYRKMHLEAAAEA